MKDHMLDYLVALLEDAYDYSWQAAKASDAVLLGKMEQGEIQNYAQVDKLDRVRRAHAQRHVPAFANTASSTSKKPANKSIPCQYFNQGTCNQSGLHDYKSMTYKHVCATCLKITGKHFNHPEVDCRRKQAKN